MNGAAIFSTILIIIAILWAIWIFYVNWKVNQISKWNKATATVTSVTDGIKYEYVVDGITYSSTNVTYSGYLPSKDTIDKILGKVVVGSQFQIYYNPGSPGDAYIYPGTTNYNGLWIVLVLILIAIAISMGSILHKLKKMKNDDMNLDSTYPAGKDAYKYPDMV
jgi:hypothetical protein